MNVREVATAASSRLHAGRFGGSRSGIGTRNSFEYAAMILLALIPFLAVVLFVLPY